MSAWPYDDRVIEVESQQPSWSCPEGLFDCHAPTEGQAFEFAVMLCNEDGARMPGARCRVLIGGREVNLETPNADGDGWLSVVLERPVASAPIWPEPGHGVSCATSKTTCWT